MSQSFALDLKAARRESGLTQQHAVHDMAVERRQLFANKYEEAAALAERFSELAPFTPKPRRIWDKEPLNTTYFEAVALALAVIDGPAGD